MTDNKYFFGSLMLAILMLFTLGVRSQGLTADNELYREIAHMDSVLFTAFNNRDLKTFESVFSEDLEFFHDKGGLTNYTFTVESFKTTIARKNDLNRQLVPGSVEIHPIKDYGAVQTGQHRFCHTENEKQDCGTFKFVHVWKKTTAGWKLTRVVSYNH